MRIALLSDVHSNLPALEAVLAHLATQPAINEIWFLGDAVGYYPDHSAVLQRLRQVVTLGAWVAGNHDWGVIGNISENRYSSQAKSALQKTRAELSADEIALLKVLPERVERSLNDGLAATFVHATLDDPIGKYDGTLKNAATAERVSRLFTSQICIIGHTHLRHVFRESNTVIAGRKNWEMISVDDFHCPSSVVSFRNERIIINPGSVGQPRDGFGGGPTGYPHASYAILDTSAETRTCTYFRVKYDISGIQKRTRAWLKSAMEPDDLETLVDRLRTNVG